MLRGLTSFHLFLFGLYLFNFIPSQLPPSLSLLVLVAFRPRPMIHPIYDFTTFVYWFVYFMYCVVQTLHAAPVVMIMF
jgi:hypothetical protein